MTHERTTLLQFGSRGQVVPENAITSPQGRVGEAVVSTTPRAAGAAVA
jgi:hypothetical protein